MSAEIQPAKSNGPLVPDILVIILETFRGHWSTLYRCSLVNREFNQLASKMLYSQVEVDISALEDVFILHNFVSALEIDTVWSTQSFNKDLWNQFRSSCLPRNATHVLKLKITGRLYPPSFFLSPDSSGQKLSTAVQSYRNLHDVDIVTRTSLPDIFSGVLSALAVSPSLRQLSVNSNSIGETSISTCITIGNLEKLTLRDPSRAILNVLPFWLSRLSGVLTELHLVVRDSTCMVMIYLLCRHHRTIVGPLHRQSLDH